MTHMPEIYELQNKVETWRNRASMALRQGNRSLCKQALHQMRRYKTLLSELDGEDGFHNALVPKRPHPIKGAGEVALQLAEDPDAKEM